MTRSRLKPFALLALTFVFLWSCQKKSQGNSPTPSSPPTSLNPSNPIPEPIDTAENSICSLQYEAKISSETCQVTHLGSAPYTYIEGTILYEDGPMSRSSLLINPKGLLSCTGCDCLAEAKALDATRISCPNGLVSPALINGHDHLTWANVRPQSAGEERFEHRNDWRGGKRGHKKISVPSGGSNAEILFGEIRQLMVGTVSIAGSNSAPGFLRNLDSPLYREGLGNEAMDYDTFPLESGGDYDFRVGNCAYSRQPALAYLDVGRHLMHVAEGIDDAARNEFLCLSGRAEGGRDAIEARNTIVHGIGLVAEDAKEMAANGTALVWSPRSNISLYGNTAAVPLLKRSGVNVALGTDWVPSGSAHLLREAQCALHMNEDFWSSSLSDQELWQMMTSKAASAFKMEREIGRIAKGLQADIVIYRRLKAKNVYRSIMNSEAKDTALVLRSGLPLYGDDVLLKALVPQEDCGSVNVCGEQKALCYSREAKLLASEGLGDLSALVSKMEASANAYPLFFCEAPKDEPSCEPMRKGEYEGKTSLDQDGDGIANEKDNCPNVFNPIRPLDKGLQADADNDGSGDACDICPLEKGELCEKAIDNDRDHDGILDLADNCPVNANPFQEDSDNDGEGDTCDSCALIANPEFSACQVDSMSTFNLSRNEPGLLSSLKPMASVEVSGYVNALAKSGYYLQDETSRSGIFVFLPKGDKPKLGQKLKIRGTFEYFKGEVQISNPQILEAKDGELPLATSISAQTELSTMVGLLVSVEGKISEAKEGALFTLDDVWNIGNFFALFPAPNPLLGDRYRVTGILRREGESYRLEPRTSFDLNLLESGPPRAKALLTSLAFVELSSGSLPSLKLELDRPASALTVANLEVFPLQQLVANREIRITEGTTVQEIPLQLDPMAKEGKVNFRLSLGESQVETEVNLIRQFKPSFVDSTVSELSAWVGLPVRLELKLSEPQSYSQASVVEARFDSSKVTVKLLPLEAGSLTQVLEVTGIEAGTLDIQLNLNGKDLLIPTVVRRQDLIISEVFYDPAGDDSKLEWIEIRNMSGKALDLSQYKIGAGGVNYRTMIYPLKGMLPPDACVVVGGPLSSEKNFSPTLFQAEVFPGGLQNGGVNVDAIGIFLGDIQTDSLPIDVFAYGESNKDGFLGADGKILAPNLTLVKSGASAERQGLLWKEQVKPTPGDCSALKL